MGRLINPEARLEARESDVRLSNEQFLQLSLFSNAKRKPSLDKFPGAWVLRHFKEGDVVYRQGEAGWTAFYILTSQDVLGLRRGELAFLKGPLREQERALLEEE